MRLLSLLLILPLTLHAQVNRLGEDVQFEASARGTYSSGQYAPFWFTSNQYGLSTTANNSGYLRAAISRAAEADSLRCWRLGYGADMAVPFGMDSHFVVQQLYADVQWKALRLSLGQKERPLELRNQSLSVGSMTTGINARPLPQVRLELPDYFGVPFTKDWLSLKGHIAYGWYTDNKWLRENYAAKNQSYATSSKYHSKALFLRVGKEQTFPLFLTLGFEMSSQFGGYGWNLRFRVDHKDPNFNPNPNLGNGLKSYLDAFIPGGNDVSDGDYPNASGNHLGSYHLRLDYKGHGWNAAFYFEHFYEDHSQLFFQYGWKDKTLGGEIQLPRNRFLSTLVYEYIRTTDQSGAIYHDATSTLPLQISGRDQYYCHQIYGAWQHAGFVMGNPLLISPIYGFSKSLRVYHNRIKANHIGLSGQPTDWCSWRVLYTHEMSFGEYDKPVSSPQHANYCLLELTVRPRLLPGLGVTAAYGHNDGEILGKSNGGMLTVSYSGLLNPSRK